MDASARPILGGMPPLATATHRVRANLRRLAVRFAGLPHADDGPDRATPEVAGDLTRLWRTNLLGRRSVVDPASRVDVSLASHGHRIDRVWVAIEAIARGDARPRRIHLVLDEGDAVPQSLRRLQRRGLEIVHVDATLGPHKKHYPSASGPRDPDVPLATADDDAIYPPTWLAGLLAAAERSPDALIAHRAHRIAIDAIGSGPTRRGSPAPRRVPRTRTSAPA